jgi:hypothetical protein
LSEIGWQQKLTAVYNLLWHNVVKIVEASDPEKRQTHKAERGNLIIQLVINRPVSAGFLVNKYDKYFCNWG